MFVSREAWHDGFLGSDGFGGVSVMETSRYVSRKATNERVHGVGQGGTTKNTQSLSSDAQLQHQQDSW